MKNSSLIILMAIAIGLVFFGWSRSGSRKQQGPQSKVQLVKFAVDAVREIHITPGEGEPLILKATSDMIWMVPSLDYKADSSKVGNLLLSTALLESNQKVTENPANYDRLGITGKASKNLLFKDVSGQVIAGLEFGRERERPQGSFGDPGQYIKPLNQASVYLVRGKSLDVSIDAAEWLDTTILKLPAKDIKAISVLSSEPALEISMDSSEDKDQWNVQGLKEGEKARDWVPAGIAGHFEDLSFSKVFKRNADDVKDIAFRNLLKVQAKSGLIYSFSGDTKDGEFYLGLSTLTETDANDTLVKTSLELNSRFERWVYLMESWNAANFQKKYEDFVEAPPSPEEAVTPAPRAPISKPASFLRTPPEETDHGHKKTVPQSPDEATPAPTLD